MKYVIAQNEQQMNNNKTNKKEKKWQKITTTTQTAKNPYNFNRFRFYLFIYLFPKKENIPFILLFLAPPRRFSISSGINIKRMKKR